MQIGSIAEWVSGLGTFAAVIVALMPVWSARSKEKLLANNLRNQLNLELKDLEKASYQLRIEGPIDLSDKGTNDIRKIKPELVSKFIRCVERLRVLFTQTHLISDRERDILWNLIYQCIDLSETFETYSYNRDPHLIITQKSSVQKSIDEYFRLKNEQNKPNNNFINRIIKIVISCF